MSEPRDANTILAAVDARLFGPAPRDPREPSTAAGRDAVRDLTGPLAVAATTAGLADVAWYVRRIEDEARSSASPAIRDETPDGPEAVRKGGCCNDPTCHHQIWLSNARARSTGPGDTARDATPDGLRAALKDIAAVALEGHREHGYRRPAGEFFKTINDLAEAALRSTGPGDTDGGLDAERLRAAIVNVRDSDPAEWLDLGDEADAIAAAYRALTGSPDTEL